MFKDNYCLNSFHFECDLHDDDMRERLFCKYKDLLYFDEINNYVYIVDHCLEYIVCNIIKIEKVIGDTVDRSDVYKIYFKDNPFLEYFSEFLEEYVNDEYCEITYNKMINSKYKRDYERKFRLDSCLQIAYLNSKNGYVDDSYVSLKQISFDNLIIYPKKTKIYTNLGGKYKSLLISARDVIQKDNLVKFDVYNNPNINKKIEKLNELFLGLDITDIKEKINFVRILSHKG